MQTIKTFVLIWQPAHTKPKILGVLIKIKDYVKVLMFLGRPPIPVSIIFCIWLHMNAVGLAINTVSIQNNVFSLFLIVKKIVFCLKIDIARWNFYSKKVHRFFIIAKLIKKNVALYFGDQHDPPIVITYLYWLVCSKYLYAIYNFNILTVFSAQCFLNAFKIGIWC